MGGKAFPDIVPIPYDHYYQLVEAVDKIVKPHICVPVGSGRQELVETRKLPLNDLDVLVEMPKADWPLFLANLRDIGMETKLIHEFCVSTCMILDGNRYQVDFMHTEDFINNRFIFWTDIDSQYKSAHRNILIQAMINVKTTKLFGDSLRTKQHLDLYEGKLMYLVQTRGNAIRYKTVDRIDVKENIPFPFCIAHFLGFEWLHFDLEKIKSFEMLLNHIKSLYSTDEMRLIAIECDKIIRSTKLEVPKELGEFV